MKIQLPFNAILGISVEVLYAFAVMAAGFLLCLVLSLL
jgi:hypothetical protein